MKKLSWRSYLGVALLTFALFLPGRMTLPPLDRDEPRYMEASAQMLESHHYIDVRFLDKPRYLQPAGIYWLEAATEKLFGGPLRRHVAWPYRIPSLIATSLATTLTAYIGALLFDGLTGLFAAGFLATSILMAAEGRMATIDATLLLATLLAEAALLRAYLDQKNHRDTKARFALLYWASIGFGLMLKGPVILIPAFGTVIGLWIVERDRSWWWRLRPKWGWLISFGIVLPWCIGIYHVSHGAFFTHAVGTNFLGKIGHGQEAHGLPPGFHLAVFSLAFWPGSLFFILGLPHLWQNRKTTQIRFLLCWIIPHWLVFEAIATKLPHYVLPVYPAIAVLTACALPQGVRRLQTWKPARIFFYGYAFIWTLLSLSIAGAGFTLLWWKEGRFSSVALLCSVTMVICIVLSLKKLVKDERRVAALWGIVASALLQFELFLVVIPHLSLIQLAPRAANLFLANQPCRESNLVSVSYSEPSLAFLVGTSTHFLGLKDAPPFLLAHHQCSSVLVDIRSVKALTTDLARRGITLDLLGHVSGLNYSNGHHLDLELFNVRDVN